MHQVDQSFLSCNAPDEDHRRSVRVHPDVTAHIGLGDGIELVRVDPIAHHTDDVRDVVENTGEQTSEIGIPRVGMDEVDLVRDGIDHGQVCAEGPQRAVGTFRIVLSVGGGSFTRLSHA
ncbi:hypothetical protein BXA17_20165, partial [Acinetobacter baumannii]